MQDEHKLELDESMRISQHEAVKSGVRETVHSRIVDSAEELSEKQQPRFQTVANELEQKAIREVVDTENELERGKQVARLSQVIDYCFYLIYGLIGLEIILELLGARESSGFKQLIDTVSAPFLYIFHNLMPDPTAGPFRLMLSYIFALVVYLLLHMAINGLLRLFVHKKTAL
jgi:uncharacterized protein YggT (Ycf19 family)